jgi:hypothetical protein
MSAQCIKNVGRIAFLARVIKFTRRCALLERSFGTDAVNARLPVRGAGVDRPYSITAAFLTPRQHLSGDHALDHRNHGPAGAARDPLGVALSLAASHRPRRRSGGAGQSAVYDTDGFVNVGAQPTTRCRRQRHHPGSGAVRRAVGGELLWRPLSRDPQERHRGRRPARLPGADRQQPRPHRDHVRPDRGCQRGLFRMPGLAECQRKPGS